jgi:selenocysteine-specific elongation factor
VFAANSTQWDAALATLEAQIAAYHRAAPHSQGLKTSQIRSTGVVPSRWLDAALAALLESGRVRETGGHFHRAGHRAALPPEDASLLKRIDALIDRDQPPSIGDIAKSLGIPLRSVNAFVTKVASLGYLVRVGTNHVLQPERIERLAAIAAQIGSTRPDGFDARAFRDAAGIGRNLAIDVLEYFDRRGFTRRYADVRRIVGDASTLVRQ